MNELATFIAGVAIGAVIQQILILLMSRSTEVHCQVCGCQFYETDTGKCPVCGTEYES